MGHSTMPIALMEMVAERFKSLAQPARLQILNALRDSEKSVSQLMEITELGQANISRHLQILYKTGFVKRRKRSQNVFYVIADDDIYKLCDIICGKIEAEIEFTSKSIHSEEELSR